MKIRLQWLRPSAVERAEPAASARPREPIPERVPVPGLHPLEAHAGAASWTPAPARAEAGPALEVSRPKRDPARAVAYIERFEASLALHPEVLAARRALMLGDPSSFFRANPGLFHTDLQGAFAASSALVAGPAAPLTTILGDPHLFNFGVLRGPEGEAVFAPNDFDQSAHGSPTADLARLAVSVALQARAQGLGAKEERELVETLAKHYFDELEAIAEEGAPRRPFLTEREASGRIEKRIEKGDERSRNALLEGLLVGGSKGVRFLQGGELQPVAPPLRSLLEDSIEAYALQLPRGARGLAHPLPVLDLVEKQGGGGSSLGLPRYYALIAREGRRPIVLELKELLPVALDGDAGALRGDASMVTVRQRALGGLHNPLTGWAELGGRSLLVREVEPQKAKLEPKDLDRPKELEDAAEQTAVLLARSHARTAAFAEAMGSWVRGDGRRLRTALATYARSHANQVEADFAAFQRHTAERLGIAALTG